MQLKFSGIKIYIIRINFSHFSLNFSENSFAVLMKGRTKYFKMNQFPWTECFGYYWRLSIVISLIYMAINFEFSFSRSFSTAEKRLNRAKILSWVNICVKEFLIKLATSNELISFYRVRKFPVLSVNKYKKGLVLMSFGRTILKWKWIFIKF